MDNTEYIPVLSLCPGSLGLERGVKRVWPGIREIAYVEIEAFINFNLVAAMEAGLVDQAPIWTDVKTFDGCPFRNKVHGIIAGYPCQGESSAGLRKLEKDPRYLWPHIRRIISETKPVWCFFENVRSHISGTFKYVHRGLRNLGYEVEPGIYSAAEVGASHIRERLFILACSDVREMWRCMANANSKQWSISEKPRRDGKATATNGPKDVADTNGKGLQIWNEQGKINGKAGSIAKSDGILATESSLANTNSARSRENSQEYQAKEFNKNGTQWPAPPGEPQHEWEAPRTLPKRIRRKGSPTKSGMGSTVNGHNFRVELLRMYGNGVVPDVSEKAFRDLLRKHFKNHGL